MTKSRVWCIRFDGKILGYFPDFITACSCVMDGICPDQCVSIFETEILVEDE